MQTGTMTSKLANEVLGFDWPVPVRNDPGLRLNSCKPCGEIGYQVVRVLQADV